MDFGLLLLMSSNFKHFLEFFLGMTMLGDLY